MLQLPLDAQYRKDEDREMNYRNDNSALIDRGHLCLANY